MKKILLIIMTIMMSFSTIIQEFYYPLGNVNAVSGHATTIPSSTSEFEISGKGSLGKLLANEFEETSESTQELKEDLFFGINDVEVNGNIANVNYYANDNATMVVAIYNENANQLLAKGIYEIETKNEKVENFATEILLVGDIPEYFLVKVFILDDNQIPLCDEYISNMYTEEITRLRKSDIYDYDSDLVVNLDDNEETNFLVLNEITKKIEYNAETNILEKSDDVNRVYIFNNCDEMIKELAIGDVFYYDYNKEVFLTIKVKNITKEGDTVTIYGDDTLEIEEVFQAIKIEEVLTVVDAEENSEMKVGTDIGYGMRYEGLSSSAKSEKETQTIDEILSGGNKKDSEHSASIDVKKFRWEYSNDEGKTTVDFGKFEGSVKGEVSAEIAASIEIKLRLYQVGFLKEAGSLTIDPKIQINGEFNISGEIKFILSEFNWKTFFDLIEFSESFAVVFSGEIKGSLNGTLSFLKMTFTVGDSSKKFFSFNLAEFNGEAKIETKFYLGLELSAKIKVLEYEISGDAKTGVQAESVLISSKNDDTDECIHSCDKCISGEVYLIYSYTFKRKDKKSEHISASNGNGVEAKYKLFEFYWSISNSDFGLGFCPNNYHKTLIEAVSSTGKPIANAKITGFVDHEGKTSAFTDSNGKACIYLKPGEYRIQITAIRYDVEENQSYHLNVTNEPNTINYKFIPDELPVKIKVIDENGNPVINAKVHTDTKSAIVGDNGIYIVDGLTDANGEVILKIATVSNTGTDVNVTNFGNSISISDNLYFSEDNLEFVFLLNEQGGFVGEAINLTVIDQNDNRIANATVEIGEVDYSILDKGDKFYSCGSFSTDSNGKAVIRFPLHSRVDTFRVSADGFPEIIDNFVLVEGINNYVFRLSETYGGFVGNSSDNNDNNDENNNKPPTEIIASGECGADGENLTWTLDDEGTLTISGEGEMSSYYSTAPWYSNRENITDIVMEDGITSIGSHAFESCNSLTSITIPDSVTTIGGESFYNCKNLSVIKISNNVTTIGYSAFYDCESLTSITIPDGVTSIEDSTFYGCESLTSIIIPDSVTSIGEDACKYCTSLISVTIPDSVTSIGSGAFSGCESLTSITIPDSVTSIEGSTFYSCKSLSSIIIPNSITSIGNYVFYDCDSLTSITIPDSVTILGEKLFADCGNLKHIIVSNNIISADNIIYNCPASIYGVGGSLLHEKYEDQFYAIIPSPDVEVLYSGMFGEDGNNLKWELDSDGRLTISGEGAMPRYHDLSDLPPWDSYKSMIRIAVIEEGVTNIGAAFWEHSSLKLVSIPSSVEEIQYAAFSKCIDLEDTFTCVEDIYDLQLNGIVIPEGVKRIEEAAFNNCSKIEKISIPSTLSRLDAAFKNTAWSYYNSNGLVYLDNWVYQYNENINEKEVEIKQGTVGIASGAFEDCDNLTSITIPDGVVNIGEKAFYECDNLTSIKIPDSVTNIGGHIFH